MRGAVMAPAKIACGLKRVRYALRRPYEYAVLYLGLLLFALPMMVWSLVAAVLYRVLPRRIGASLGRLVLTLMFRAYLAALRATGLVKLDLGALDALREESSLIIAPNHPSMLDAVLVVSRLSRVACIMKAEIRENVLFGGSSNLARYIRNNSALGMVRAAAAAVRAGNQLLVFPEGTRTRRAAVNPFKGGFALIAKTTGVPVQTVFIETNSLFLSKGWPLFRMPTFPLIYRATLGQRFEVDGDVKTFVADLEDYYRQTLAASDMAAWISPHE